MYKNLFPLCHLVDDVRQVEHHGLQEEYERNPPLENVYNPINIFLDNHIWIICFLHHHQSQCSHNQHHQDDNV